MRTFPRFFAVIALSFAVLPLAAQTHEVGLSVGTADVPGFGDINAVGAHYNHFWTSNVSTKFGVTRYDGDLEEGTFARGELDMKAWTAAAQYHLLPGRLFSPYVAAGGAFVTSTLDDTAVGDVEGENDFAALVGGGVDVNITPRFSFGLDVTYLHGLDLDFAPVVGVGMDPLTYSAGVKLKW